MLKLAKEVDWLSGREQEIWFNQFKSTGFDGIKFNQFQEFLKSTIYAHFNPTNEIKHKFTCQQEIQLFKIFDLKNNHILNLDEFKYLCQNWLHRVFKPSSALVIVDVQNDFIDGSLALVNGPANQDGAEVVPVINNLLDSCSFQTVVYTQDWHPIDHIGFHDNLHLRKYSLKDNDSKNDNSDLVKENDATGNLNGLSRVDKLAPKVNLFDTVLFDEGRMEQKIWPTHCIQDSWGAELHPKLKVLNDSIRILKGTLPHVDAYSAFWDNMRLNETGLKQELISRKIDDVYFCGLALDYCVSASAIDSAKAGFTTFVIEDACRGIDLLEMEKRKFEMLNCGIFLIDSTYLHERQNNLIDHCGFKNMQQQLDICLRKALANTSDLSNNVNLAI